jgi:hypothetical protein
MITRDVCVEHDGDQFQCEDLVDCLLCGACRKRAVQPEVGVRCACGARVYWVMILGRVEIRYEEEKPPPRRRRKA